MASIEWRSSNTSAPYVTLTLTQGTQSVTNNTTVVSYELVLHRPLSISSSASKSYSITINGTKVASGTTTIGGSGNKTIKSGSITITHNTDGTKSISMSFSLELEITFSGTYLGTASASGTMSLTTIPRKSSFTVSNGTLGTAQTITITRASSSFTHTITYKCGSYSGTIANKTTSTSVSYTPALALANSNTTGTTVSILLTLYTYSGSTSIGSATKTISCSMPASIKPTISSITVGSSPTAHLTTYNGFVKDNTKATFTISATPSYSSDIASYKVVVNGVTYSKTTNAITTNNLTTSGNLTATITVTDKRGRTASTTRTLTVLDYSPPVINTAKVTRCDFDGTTNARGEYCKLNYKITVSALNNVNTKTFSYKYKLYSASEYNTYTLPNSTYVVEDFVIFSVSVTDSYNVILTAVDDFNTTTKNLTLSAGSAIMNWLANKLGMAVGKIAELSGYFDIGYKTIHRADIYMDNYSDAEKNFYWMNDSYRDGRTYEDNGLYPHGCKIYGGNSGSKIGIGMFDNAHSKRIFAYDDTALSNIMGVPLYFNNAAQFETDTMPNASVIAMKSGYYNISGYICKWGCVVFMNLHLATGTAISAGNITNITLGTCIAKYRPVWNAPLSSSGAGPNCTGMINTSGDIILATTAGAIEAGSTATSFSLGGTWIANFT